METVVITSKKAVNKSVRLLNTPTTELLPESPHVPNKATLRAMEDARLGRNLTSYDSVAAMFADIFK
ncbi:hypothetical protein Barb6_00154 [Bacteroidales bacterium Barb6]|nr:hypothetical protein Barb6_00154 [Bacteroidales bacterium Barb6]